MEQGLSEAAAGGQILKPAHDVFWGIHYFADPDGHLWEAAWSLHWTIADDGSMQLPRGLETRPAR